MASASYNTHPLPAPPQQGQYYSESYQPPVPPQHNYLQQQRQQRLQQAPAPQPPEPQRQERIRPKSRAFSFRSDKSQKSANSHNNKSNLHETSTEKEANRLHGKTDPTLALTESEPGMWELQSWNIYLDYRAPNGLC